jgi:hypothetical protein
MQTCDLGGGGGSNLGGDLGGDYARGMPKVNLKTHFYCHMFSVGM